MYMQSFLRLLLLLCFLVSEYGAVQAYDIAVVDEEAKLRAVQERRIESLTPKEEEGIVSVVTDDHDMSNSTERRRGWRSWWRRIKSWWRRYRRSPWRVRIGRGRVGISYHRKF